VNGRGSFVILPARIHLPDRLQIRQPACDVSDSSHRISAARSAKSSHRPLSMIVGKAPVRRGVPLRLKDSRRALGNLSQDFNVRLKLVATVQPARTFGKWRRSHLLIS